MYTNTYIYIGFCSQTLKECRLCLGCVWGGFPVFAIFGVYTCMHDCSMHAHTHTLTHTHTHTHKHT